MKVELSNTELRWECPASICGDHSIPVRRTGVEAKRNWEFNGDVNNPTIKPSIKATWAYVDDKPTKTCHFFITNGRIEFCGDCTHELAGKTVEMKECEV
jgi:hypothetical protein